MAKFYVCTNNGVTAVAPEWVYEEVQRREDIRREMLRAGQENASVPPAQPVFTFSDSEALRHYVTGTNADMEAVLEGCEVVQKGMYVPFSNGTQWAAAGPEDQKWVEMELSFRTTLGEAITAFGLRPHPELAHGSDRPATSRIQWRPASGRNSVSEGGPIIGWRSIRTGVGASGGLATNPTRPR